MLVAKCNVCMNTSMHILSSCIYAFFPFGELCSENGIVKVLLPKARYNQDNLLFCTGWHDD